MTAALRTERLSRHFGAVKANSDVTLAFPTGARHALIGPNGAGKTTLINLLTGVLAPTAGDVYPVPLANSQIKGGGSRRLSFVSVENALCDGPRNEGQSAVTASFASGFGAL